MKHTADDNNEKDILYTTSADWRDALMSNFRFGDIDGSGMPLHEGYRRTDFYQILFLEEGRATHVLDFNEYAMHGPSASVVFPNQIQSLRLSPEAKGRCILFDTTIFCSEDLATELREYNVDLQRRINMIDLSDNPSLFADLLDADTEMRQLYHDINPVRKLRIKFMIKTILLTLIDSSHEVSQPIASETQKLYIEFRTLIDKHYRTERKLSFYCDELGISQKKLTAICQERCGMSPLAVIHDRLSLEIKKLILRNDMTLKEIAYRLNFSSQSALNKYISTKFSMTPSELVAHVREKY